jgi:ribosomal protein L37AE/L43A
MIHFCGGTIIFIREEDIWYCQRCGVKHVQLSDFSDDNKSFEESELENGE